MLSLSQLVVAISAGTPISMTRAWGHRNLSAFRNTLSSFTLILFWWYDLAHIALSSFTSILFLWYDLAHIGFTTSSLPLQTTGSGLSQWCGCDDLFISCCSVILKLGGLR